MYYDYQRWYDPSIGRFISQDPNPSKLSDPQTLNIYPYTRDSPTTFTDPSGLAVYYGPTLASACWDWFGLLPCHKGGTAGAVSTITTTSGESGPAGPLIAIGAIGIYVGGSALYNFLENYFASNPLSTTNPGGGGNDGSDRTTPSRTGSSTGRIGTGPTVTPPTITNPAGQFGTIGQSTFFGTRIAVDNPVLDPYRPRNTSVPPPSTRALVACTTAVLIGVGLGIYADVESSKFDLELPAEGALWAGAGCVGLLLMSHLWT